MPRPGLAFVCFSSVLDEFQLRPEPMEANLVSHTLRSKEDAGTEPVIVSSLTEWERRLPRLPTAAFHPSTFHPPPDPLCSRPALRRSSLMSLYKLLLQTTAAPHVADLMNQNHPPSKTCSMKAAKYSDGGWFALG
ncbi:unnamed protein product [Durusdinium trenchii]|uniref:Uncharacterized protein n=1 Tax=Durusdinium trenchii TaxID=1381693 RepID=A0ABP0Q0T5_9DINO